MSTNSPVTLINVQTGSGKLTVTDTSISIERPAFPRPKTQTLFRANIVGIDYKVIARPKLFSKGSVTLTFHVQSGERAEVHAVPYDVAAALLAQFGQSLP